jgi:hypothetical protein
MTDGISPTAPSHGRCFTWCNDYEHLADSQELDVDDVRAPLVWTVTLADVQKYGLGRLTFFLCVVRCMQSVTDRGPEWIGMRVARLGLFEVESARSVSSACSDGLFFRCRAGSGQRSVRENNLQIAEVDKLMEGFHDLATNGRESGLISPEATCAFVLTPSNLVV